MMENSGFGYLSVDAFFLHNFYLKDTFCPHPVCEVTTEDAACHALK